MNILGTHIETDNLIISRLEDGDLWSVMRKILNTIVGTITFSAVESKKTFEFNSVKFNIDVPAKDAEHGIGLTEYILDIIEGLVNIVFEELNIDIVAVCYADFSEQQIERLVKLGFDKKEGKLYLTRSKWGRDNGEIVSVALFDILGFSNLIKSRGNFIAMQLYRELVKIIKNHEGNLGIVPAPISQDWTSSAYCFGIYSGIHISYFSDTFLIWTTYKNSLSATFWTSSKYEEPFPLLIFEPGALFYPILYEKHHIYLSFLEICMDFFCQSIISGIPLRGCVATGLAKMDTQRSIFVGSTLVEVARGEAEQNAIGFAFGQSFNNSHPVYNKYFIPYLQHKKDINKADSFLSPMMVDYPRYWRKHYQSEDFVKLVNKMNQDKDFVKYYDNAIKFFKFSERHQDWPMQINKDGVKTINDYYNKIKQWLSVIDKE
jgi:hypothetical protein